MKQRLQGAAVWDAAGVWRRDCPVLLENGRIIAVGEDCRGIVADSEVDLSGAYLLPGLIDVHTHGRSGYDFSTATEEQMQTMKAEYLRHGVTSVFPTLASATPEEWLQAMDRIQACDFDGIHFEGRYLNPQKRGAHPTHLLAELDAEELMNFLSRVTLPSHLTAAFELDTNGLFTAIARSYGTTLGLGHTAATAKEAEEALTRGVTSFTHLFNAMPPLHHRDGGAVSVALTDPRAYSELIVDGVHVCPEMVKLAYRCLGRERLVLITDSMEATGCPDGTYSIAGQPVQVVDGRALTLDGVLAGSTLELWDGVKNLMKFASIPLEEAIACATVNPARMVGIEKKVGSIEAGKLANLLVVDPELQITNVIWRGCCVNA
ncbi:MAG: N-acetylglucosamine-6-phosphate deacetylase [Clostridia bacterium]|nr:N-acetylglucosamine-6-phosphate deacetylase [Clostridia bacterium]